MITLYLPEPPSLNRMLDYRGGGWQVYHGKQQSYQKKCRLLLPARPPDAPWVRWAIREAHLRLWSLRDPLELDAGIKWAVDVLTEEGWVLDDGPDFLVKRALATQEMCRGRGCHRGLTLTIERMP
jgi:hypothetical protein